MYLKEKSKDKYVRYQHSRRKDQNIPTYVYHMTDYHYIYVDNNSQAVECILFDSAKIAFVYNILKTLLKSFQHKVSGASSTFCTYSYEYILRLYPLKPVFCMVFTL